VFLVVEGTLISSIWRYRRRRGVPTAAQIRGNPPLEIGWTVAAALILVVLTAVTFIYLDDIKDPPGAGAGTLAGPTQQVKVEEVEDHERGGAGFAGAGEPSPQPTEVGVPLLVEAEELPVENRPARRGPRELAELGEACAPVAAPAGPHGDVPAIEAYLRAHPVPLDLGGPGLPDGSASAHADEHRLDEAGQRFSGPRCHDWRELTRPSTHRA
jgi:hypothetical protein